MSQAAVAAALVLVTAGAFLVAAGATGGVGARRRLDHAPSPGTGRQAPAWVAPRLHDVDVAIDPNTAWNGWCLVALVLAVAGVALGGIGLGAVGLVVWCGMPLLLWVALRHRAEVAVEAAVPGALDAVARGLRSGGSLLLALQEAAAASPPALRADLLEVTAKAERGLGLVPALEEWAESRPVPAVRLATAALCLGAETGGAQARAIDGVAMTIRQRLGVAGEARSLATQARLSGLVIALSPVGFCLLAATADPRVGTLLFRTPLGWFLLGSGLALDGLGAAWMARLTRPRV